MVADASRDLANAASGGMGSGGGISGGLMAGGLLGGLMGSGGGGLFDILQQVPSIMQNLNATGAFGKTSGNSVIQNGAVQITFQGSQTPETVEAAKNQLGPALIRAIMAGVGSN
jgi:predicted lipid-binding transport protein (Tim44 family)